jgi:hypothetical protein
MAEMDAEVVIHRSEVTAIIGALADILVELRAIRSLLDDGEEEEEDLEE